MFPDSGLCTGREKPAARIETLRTRQITFGTLQLVKEALDEKTLDTIFFLTPFGSSAIEDGGKNTLQQGMGRILGYRGGGNHPVVVIMDHMFIPKFHKACRQLKKLINEWPADEGGPLEYTILADRSMNKKGTRNEISNPRRQQPQLHVHRSGGYGRARTSTSHPARHTHQAEGR